MFVSVCVIRVYLIKYTCWGVDRKELHHVEPVATIPYGTVVRQMLMVITVESVMLGMYGRSRNPPVYATLTEI